MSDADCAKGAVTLADLAAAAKALSGPHGYRDQSHIDAVAATLAEVRASERAAAVADLRARVLALAEDLDGAAQGYLSGERLAYRASAARLRAAVTDTTGGTQTDDDPATTADLTGDHFGWWVEIPTRQVSGYLYAIRDEFHDGYPGRYLVLVDEDGHAVEEEFTDSNPSGCPKTLRTPCLVRPTGTQQVAGQMSIAATDTTGDPA